MRAASFALILGVLASAMPAVAGSGKQDIVDTAVRGNFQHTVHGAPSCRTG